MAVQKNQNDVPPKDFGFLNATGNAVGSPNPADLNFGSSSENQNNASGSAPFDERGISEHEPDGAAGPTRSDLTIAKKKFTAAAGSRNSDVGNVSSSIPTRNSPVLVGYAIAITLLLVFFLATGRLSLFGNHALESLPDLRPLSPNEFRKVPDGTALPAGHVMKIGAAQRFGDVVVTPLRITQEPLRFQHFQTGSADESLTTLPVLKLWMRFENVADDYGFPPFDAGLMSSRTPEYSKDESTITNSFLSVRGPSDSEEVRILNYLQSPNANFVISGQQLSKTIMPNETLETFIACNEEVAAREEPVNAEYLWRIQIRKGVNQESGNGVTTLIEVQFSSDEIEKSQESVSSSASG